MGRWLHWAGRPWPAQPPWRAFCGGALAWVLGAAVVLGLAVALERGLWALLLPDGWAAGGVAARTALVVALALLLKPMLAWRLLRDEVVAVEQALADGLPAGRARVARLCSRDTAALDAVQVRETAIETLAENLNDSVVAPLFWWALAGLPGAALYRYANTADAMWGYRGHWEWAGKWAAWADDGLSWLPARLTGVLLRPDPRHWPRLRREAAATPSPNGGWPMGAMALALGCTLHKPGVYRLNAAGAPAQPADTGRALAHAGRAVGWAGALLALLAAGWRW
jgi:adenosylcobinamide-phosphate synthase